MTQEEFELLEIKCDWQVDDGYITGKRPQKTIYKPYDYFDLDEWENMSYDEKIKHISDEVQEDFNNKISWFFEINPI